jgi:hypothetical protein
MRPAWPTPALRPWTALGLWSPPLFVCSLLIPPDDAHMAKVLTEDAARRIASNIVKLPVLLGAAENSDWDFPEGWFIAHGATLAR